MNPKGRHHGGERPLVLVRGAGDLATGVIQAFHRAGFRVLCLETAAPSAIRRMVALSEAVYEGSFQVEDVLAVRAATTADALSIMDRGAVALLVDADMRCLSSLRPLAVIDAILAKRNLGLRPTLAATVVALGPGFVAAQDAHIVIETQRGHDLGRLIFSGEAEANSAVPAVIAGRGAERVLRAPCEGIFTALAAIGDTVEAGDLLATVGQTPVTAPFRGLIRGLLRSGYLVSGGFKLGDIDPRLDERKNCFLVSDKARALGGAALTAVLLHSRLLAADGNLAAGEIQL